MGSRNVFNENQCGSHTMLVDQMIGSAYAIVKQVADNLKYILQVSNYMDEIVDIADFKQRLMTVNSLGALGSTTVTDLPDEVIADGIELVNVSVNVQKVTGELYPDSESPITAVVVNDQISITLSGSADASFVNCKAFIRLSYRQV